MTRRTKLYANVDWLTILVWMLLVIFGWMNVYSANYLYGDDSVFDFSQRYGKQMIWIGLSIVMIIIIFILDTKFFPFFAYPLYGIMLIMLIALFIFGREINGAKSWFVLGGFRLQPSEFAKPFTALALARLISSHGFTLKKFQSLLHALAIIFTPALLILMQPDMGSTLVYFAFLLVLYREGFSQNTMILGAILIVLFILTLLISKSIIILCIWLLSLLLFRYHTSLGKIFLGMVLPGAILFSILFSLNQLPAFGLTLDQVSFITFAGISLITLINIAKSRKPSMYKILAGMVISVFFVFTVDYAMNNVLKEHQRQRIYVTMGIEDDPQGVGYNLNQSKIAIGSGGFSGKGFLKGTQTKLQFVPEQSTDFIFCTVGEEWGFIGTSVVVLLFVLLIVRLVLLAERQRSLFSRIFGYSLISVILVHFVVNIGMTIGLLPVIGIPLPFFSYGGSSLMAFTLFLYIFLRLDSNRKELLR
jgi:rod shape determining protein RodA